MKTENIKFKAKRLDNNTWVEGYFYAECGNTYIIEDMQSESMLNRNEAHQVDPSTVCQFTGLKDKNGNEIYEHDLISISEDREPCEVIFEKGCFLAFNPKTLIRIPLIRGINDYAWELHIVGNKFDKENNL